MLGFVQMNEGDTIDKMSAAIKLKRETGRFYTEGNPFTLEPFKQWGEMIGLKNKKVLEPFAGANNIIQALKQIGYAEKFASFDIHPNAKEVSSRDTLKDFPSGFEVCITNPPWLAKNSAKRRKLNFPNTQFDDLYKHALSLCLKNCRYTAAIIPATYLQSGLFRDRLDTIIFLHNKGMFVDTENPVCLALFNNKPSRIKIFYDNKFIGFLDQLEQALPSVPSNINITFNAPHGSLGFIAFDDTKGPSIRFVLGEEIDSSDIVHTSRMRTRIDFYVDHLSEFIKKLNNDLDSFRETTHDVFLTPFKGLRRDGYYRRRMDYRLARDFIAKHANSNSRL